MAKQYRDETQKALKDLRSNELVEKYLNDVLYPLFPNWRTSEQRALAEFIKRNIDNLHLHLMLANEAYGDPRLRLRHLHQARAYLLQIEFETRTAYKQKYSIGEGKKLEMERYEGLIGAKIMQWIKATEAGLAPKG